MTLYFRHWLPANTTAPTLARGAIADLADDWSREWFAGEPLRAFGTFVRVAGPRGEPRKTIWHGCDGLTIGLSSAGIAALGARVLGIAVVGERSPADLALLDRLGAACLDDLKRRAAILFELPRNSAWNSAEAAGADAAHRIDITAPDRNPTLTLALSEELFARFVKAKLPPLPRSGLLGAADAAFATLPARLSALLGKCGVSVAELSGLAAGDVVVLDRALDAALPLTVDGAPVPRGACTVTESGQGLALEITEALAG